MRRILNAAEILDVEIGVPAGHRHLRCTLRLRGGEELILQESTLAALVRGYVTVKSHPFRRSMRMAGRELAAGEGKEDFAVWQLLESE